MRISDWSSDVCSSDLFCQTIMGPSCGLVLADLGADVIKIEPAPGGDKTRRLAGFAAGFFTCFNRNKRSLAQIGRASCRERVCQYVYISVVAVSLKKKN